jgi:hypothetical protein
MRHDGRQCVHLYVWQSAHTHTNKHTVNKRTDFNDKIKSISPLLLLTLKGMTKLTTLENLPPHTLTTPQLRRVVATLTTRAVRSLRKDELLVLLKAINAHWADHQ